LKEFALQIGVTQGWGTDFAEIEQRLLEGMLNNLTGRLGRVEDVAHLVAFLASPLAGYINAANLRIDGGQTPTIN
jgi:NAD(P)-dependent dehydrogenase (short-subunit alcohol dehydrogenase family)